VINKKSGYPFDIEIKVGVVMNNVRCISLVSLFLCVLGCTKQPSNNDKPNPKPVVQPKTAVVNSLVVYSGRSAKLVDPIFKKFEDKTNIKILVRSGKSDGLANRIVMEGKKTEADLIFLQESGYLEALGRKDMLTDLPDALVNRVPDSYRGTENRWLGVSGRARVLVYSTKDLKPEALPKIFEALADPKWAGQVGWAPTNASFEAHVSALRHLWGEDKTKAWLMKMKAISPKKYPKNSPQVRAVGNGEIKIGWVNHYYLLRQKASQPDLLAANYVFPTDQDAGNIMMLSGVGIVKGTKKLKAAEKFVNFLLSDEIQNHLTQKNFEYPAVAGIERGAALEGLADKVSLVPQDRLTDIAGTQRLLQSVGLR
jgi:iron(III) transport system substrate-binding protein